MKKTFLYRAKLSRRTETSALTWLETCRQLYNLALEQRISVWKNHRRSLTGYDQAVQLPALRKAFPEFGAVGSQCLQDVVERLNKAYRAFFRRVKAGQKPGFPRFRGKNRYDSFTLKQAGWKLEGRDLVIARVGRFRLHLSRPIEGEIKTVTIHRTSTGKWFASFSCDSVPERRLAPTGKEVGIDVGIKAFCVDSDGGAVENPKFLLESEKLLRRRQRSLSRKKKGSKHRVKAKHLVAVTHEKVSNQRKDFLHKTANGYIETYDAIFIEDLKIRNMVKNRHLARSISDASWGMFFNLLAYKAEEAGRQVVKIHPNGTSQVCSRCSEKVPKSLSVRTHRCPFCGLVMDRDYNAALNIRALGQRVQALTRGIPCVA